MGLGSTAFSSEKLESLLRGAKVTQQSIQSVSYWMLEHRAFLREIVDVWTRLLREGDASHQIVNLYIANDAMQVGARKYGKYVAEAFEPQLLGVAEFVMASCDETVKRCLMKIVGIWKQRNIVAPSLLQMLQNVCVGKAAADPATVTTANAASGPHDEAAARKATLEQMLSDVSIEQALEDLPEVPESEFTATTSQRLQDLSTATISADLLSDRMFQLESSLSNFHAACEAFASKGAADADAGFEVVDASAGDIVWEMMEQHVFELDIDRSRDHVQQYRDTLEEQSGKRDALLAHLHELERAELFPEPLFAATRSGDAANADDSMAALHEQCRALEQLFAVCADAELIEKQREAEAQTAYAVTTSSSDGASNYATHRSGSRTVSTGGRASSYEFTAQAYNGSTSSGGSRSDAYTPLRFESAGGGAPALRRHSSSDSNGYYESDRYGGKRPKLQHSHSVDSTGSGSSSGGTRPSRWEPRRSEPLMDMGANDYYRAPYRDENHYSPRKEPPRYSQQQAPPYQQQQYGQQSPPYEQQYGQQQQQQQQQQYGQQQQQQYGQQEYHRSGSRWDSRPSDQDRGFESRERRW